MSDNDRIYPYILYLFLGSYYLAAFPYQMSASDTVFYLMSSRELAFGMLWEGINSYWGMLISVLMVPLMWIGIKGLWAFKILQLLAGFAGVHLLWKLGKHFQLQGRFAFWAMTMGVLLIWMMSMSHTPDLLMVVLLMAYFFQIEASSDLENHTSGWKAGVLGALLFLSKGYGLPFFIVHFTGWFFYQKLKYPKAANAQFHHNLSRQFRTGMLVFGLIAGTWIALLSWKYGHFTVGSSGSYNMAYMGPEMQFNPPYFDRLQNPGTEFTSYFIGEEQGLFAAYGKWNPLGSKGEFRYFLSRIPANLSKLYYITYLRDIVFLLILMGVLFLFYKIRLSLKDKQQLLAIFLFLGVYNAGYLVLFPNERYLWINHILLTFSFFKGLSLLWEVQATAKIAWVLLVVSIVLCGVNIQDRVQFRTIENRFHTALHHAKSDFENLQLENKQVVSNIQPKPAAIPDYMDPTCLLMYDHRFKLWGFIRNKKLEPSMPSGMAEMGIDYFFLWGTGRESVLFETYPLLYANPEIGLKIFDLQKKF